MLSVKARFTVGALTLGGGGLSEYRTGRTAAVRFVHSAPRPHDGVETHGRETTNKQQRLAVLTQRAGLLFLFTFR